jgi:hypothetical protein
MQNLGERCCGENICVSEEGAFGWRWNGQCNAMDIKAMRILVNISPKE